MALTARRGIALPMVLLSCLALGLLAALSLMEAAQALRIAGLAEDEVRARAAVWNGIARSLDPPDLAWLCLQPPAQAVERSWPLPNGTRSRSTWWMLPAGLVRAEVEGRGRAGARQLRVLLLQPTPPDTASAALGCPAAVGLRAAAADWIQPHPEG